MSAKIRLFFIHIDKSFVFDELLSVAFTTTVYVPTGVLAATVIVVPDIVKYVTAVPPEFFCELMLYVYVPVPFDAPVILTVFADVL